LYIATQIIKWTILGFIFFCIFFLLLARPVPDLKSLQSDMKQVKESNSTDSRLLAGIDVSHYQGKVDWSKALSENIHFVYLKATDGITYTDPRFHDNQDSLIKRKLLHGAYHFFEPNDDGVKQAENFLSQIKIHKNMLRPVLDIEITQGVDKKLIKKRVKEWLETVTLKLGCQPIIYSYSSFYKNNLGSDFLEYSVWIANYTKKPNPPEGITQFIMWQHTQKGDVAGIDTMVDRNWFFGNNCKLNSIKCKQEGKKKDE
jgi:lysozyme